MTGLNIGTAVSENSEFSCLKPGEFSGLVRVEQLADGVHDVLLEHLAYRTHDGWLIVVPAGSVTDYASIPRPLWAIIPPRGKYNRPAIVHDHLYKNAPIDSITGKPCTQSRADSIIRQSCEDVNVGRSLRWSIYAGLRVGGFVTWNRYRSGSGQKDR